MAEKASHVKQFTKGLIKENPVLALVLGTCPTLAVTGSLVGSLSMGLAATCVLLCSNVVISALRRVIPDKVRIPCYIVIIAAFVTLVKMVMNAYVPEIYNLLGVYLDLLVVNCIILGRAEMFARNNTVLDSALDGIGMGLGFTFALLCMGLIREVLGGGTFFNIEIPGVSEFTIGILLFAPGGFFVFGCLIALVNRLTKGKGVKKQEFGCAGCPSAAACSLRNESCDKEGKSA